MTNQNGVFRDIRAHETRSQIRRETVFTRSVVAIVGVMHRCSDIRLAGSISETTNAWRPERSLPRGARVDAKVKLITAGFDPSKIQIPFLSIRRI